MKNQYKKIYDVMELLQDSFIEEAMEEEEKPHRIFFWKYIAVAAFAGILIIVSIKVLPDNIFKNDSSRKTETVKEPGSKEPETIKEEEAIPRIRYEKSIKDEDSLEKITCSLQTEGAGGGNYGWFVIKSPKDLASKNPTRNNTKEITELPVFKMVEGGLGDGILGGNFVSMRMSGKIAAQVAVKILNGTPVKNFNTVIKSPNIFCIDENVMRNYGIDLSLIPDNSEVINHKKTFWENYKKVLKPGLAITLGLLLFVILSLWNGMKYKKLSEELASAKDKLENAYHHDILTGINNRTGFNKDMKELERLKIPFALMMIDIDNFKYINDTYGHIIGDEALRQIALRLKGISGANFTPYRFAGDEFIVIAKGTKDSLYEKEAEQCISIFKDVFDLSGIKHNIHGSIGIARYPQDTEDFNSLVVYADCAMYEVKNNSKNSYKFYKDICQK